MKDIHSIESFQQLCMRSYVCTVNIMSYICSNVMLIATYAAYLILSMVFPVNTFGPISNTGRFHVVPTNLPIVLSWCSTLPI